MAYSFERVVGGKPMDDGEFYNHVWQSELVDKVAATVIARRYEEAGGYAQKYTIENAGAYMDTVI